MMTVFFFPWINEKTTKKFKVSRHLNFVSNSWNDFEDYLKEDLCKICLLENFNIDLRIIEMEWELILCDLSNKVLKIPFRHPHNLFIEAPEQKTALLQIRHIYESYLNDLKKVEEFLQYGIIGWDIKVVRVHQVESYQNSLFNDESYGLSEIETIENKCLVALNCIKKKMVPFIEDSKISTDYSFENLHLLFKKRPLYKAKKPYIVSKEEIISYKFLERISHLSWNKEDSDFYEIISKDKKVLWAKYIDNGWEVHGFF